MYVALNCVASVKESVALNCVASVKESVCSTELCPAWSISFHPYTHAQTPKGGSSIKSTWRQPKIYRQVSTESKPQTIFRNMRHWHGPQRAVSTLTARQQSWNKMERSGSKGPQLAADSRQEHRHVGIIHSD